MSTDYSPLFALGTAEKLKLVEALWDNIADAPDEVPVPDWQIEELRRRKTEFLKNPGDTFTWDEVKQYVLRRHE
jgi:putative addiction module component (TIGR02574 family)